VSKHTHTIIDPRNGNLAFKLFALENSNCFDHLQRLNYYSLIWIKKGSGIFTADFTDYPVKGQQLFSFFPYQPFLYRAGETVEGFVIHFHPDFFCIHKHQAEVSCNGVLFNNIYQPPFVGVTDDAAKTFATLITQMETEMQDNALAQHEILVSYLKIFLITASRLKTTAADSAEQGQGKQPAILQNLKSSIETHFKSKHSASDYAAMLHITPKALAKLTRAHFNKTISDLIAERIVIEAKRELYLTDKPIKAIAYELGYEDEYYFSRFFKNKADISPQLYRDSVGFARAGN
jgi:YesN/AraC family two-component response regulator